MFVPLSTGLCPLWLRFYFCHCDNNVGSNFLCRKETAARGVPAPCEEYKK